jgi:hypothetical protein
MDDGDDGISRQAAGLMLAGVVVLAIAFVGVSVMVDRKSPDPLYDPDNIASHTPPSMMEPREVWRGKRREVVEEPQAGTDVRAPAPPVVRVKRAAEEETPPPQPPTTGPAGK